MTMHGGGVENKAYEGDGHLKNHRPSTTASIQREKVKLRRSEKWRILKNIAVVSFAFMVQFTAFQGTANLQSSINAKDGLGTISLSVIYAALVVSCIFVPTYVIRRLTVKWTLCLSMLCYAPYIAAQFYPKFYTLVPAGILVGLGAAPMWASKATYLTQLGQVYAKLTDQAIEAIIVRFFGFFFLAWQTAELWGNLISSLVLSSGAHGGGHSGGDSENGTSLEQSLERCGAHFCVIAGPEGETERPPDWEIYEISSIYLSCIVAAVIIIALFLDPLRRYGERRRGSITAIEIGGSQLLAATFRQLKKPNQQLLIAITVFIGMEQAFIGADFTQAYVACALGVHMIGYVMICFGVVNAICSIIFGSIMKYIGRNLIIALGALAHGGLIIFCLMWRPSPDHPLIFFLVSGVWGVGDAVWQTQINGLYGTLFRRNKEAAFSNYRLWESLGFVVAYAYSTTLCAEMKCYVLLAVLAVGVIGYIIVEIRHTKQERRITKMEQAASKEEQEQAQREKEQNDAHDELDEDIVVTHM
ncbi:UNC93-like protein [Culicoides brevitarsis]|uniref:UNC93-like protein n=1 Tax=Culicoides brevitarsis TaxID=469753 RepID=UPI00307B5ACC